MNHRERLMKSRPISACFTLNERNQKNENNINNSHSLKELVKFPNQITIDREFPTRRRVKSLTVKSTSEFMRLSDSYISFGMLNENCTYHYLLKITNVSNDIIRIQINPCENANMWYRIDKTKLSPGLSSNVLIEYNSLVLGEFNSYIDIFSEMECIKVTINGNVLPRSEYEQYVIKRTKKNRPILSNKVKLVDTRVSVIRPDYNKMEKLNISIQEKNPIIMLEEDLKEMELFPKMKYSYWNTKTKELNIWPYVPTFDESMTLKENIEYNKTMENEYSINLKNETPYYYYELKNDQLVDEINSEPIVLSEVISELNEEIQPLYSENDDDLMKTMMNLLKT